MAAKKKAVKRGAARRPVAAKKSVRKATPVAAPSTVSLPKLGAPWPGQGGSFMGIVRGDDGSNAFLILGTAQPSVLKGVYGIREATKGADSEHDGRGNTKAMAAAGSEIATKALAVKIDGHADFYIPARHEARLVFLNGKEHCEDKWHWTSTQYRAYADYAWVQYFGNGHQNYYGKGSELPVRLVRRVPFNHLTIR